MRLREWMANYAVEWARDDSHGYTNDYPDNQWWRDKLNDDCGSFMSLCLHMALLKIGIDTGYVYFEPQGGWSIYNEAFLLKYCDRYNYTDEYDKVGDILVSGGHTEMVTNLNPKQLTGARNDYDGRSGDSSGKEVATSAFYNASGGWHYIYRLKDMYNKEVDEEPIDGGWEMSKIATVQQGDSGNTVLTYQYLFKYKLGYDKMVCDGYFGEQMAYNVRDYQRDHGLYEDAVIGEKTGYSIICETGYEAP